MSIPRPRNRATVDAMGSGELRTACREACDAEGLPKSWIVSVDSDTKRAWLASVEPIPGATIAAPAPVAPAPAATPDSLADVLAAALDGKIGSAGIDAEEVRQIVRDEIEALASGSGSKAVKLAAMATTKGKGSTAADAALHRWANPTGPTCPVLLAGPAGSGKTTVARVHGRLFDRYFEYHAAPDHDLSNLLGQNIPVPEDGALGFAWVDSPLVAAFRAASKMEDGQAAMLLIDEIYHLPRSTRDALLPMLAPTLEDEYVINTGRTLSVVDGVADVETLRVPTSRLAIVATTNVGTQYGNEGDNPAGSERWQYTYCPTDWPFAEKMLAGFAADLGWSDGRDVGAMLVRFGKGTEALKASSELWHSASMRTLTRALRGSIKNDHESLIDALMFEGNTWADKDADGAPMTAQLSNLRTIAETMIRA